MSFPVDSTNPSFPAVNTAPGGRVIPAQAHAALESDRAGWVWRRRVLLSTWINQDTEGLDLVRIRARLSPVPTGSERFLRFAVFGLRSQGTHPIRAKVGTAEMEVTLSGSPNYVVDSTEVLEEGEVVDVVISDLMPDPSGTVSAQVIVYEDVGQVGDAPDPILVTLQSGVTRIEALGDGSTVVEFGAPFIPGQFTLSGAASIDVRLLVVAGGGAGGFRQGGGGGAGGVVFDPAYALEPGTYSIQVGAGGLPSPDNEGENGEDSQFDSIVAVGGGGGGSRNTPIDGRSGGSGGGGAGDGFGGAGTSLQGNAGGNGNPSLDNSAGGGGGAGEPGGDALNTSNQALNVAGDGGDGVDLSAHFGTDVGDEGWFGGGGGGGVFTSDGAAGAGGKGGGGAGNSVSAEAGEDGQQNTGGGGGGNRSSLSNPSNVPGAGGSGVVLLRFPPSVTVVDESPDAVYVEGYAITDLGDDWLLTGEEGADLILSSTGITAWVLAAAGGGGGASSSDFAAGGGGGGEVREDTALTIAAGVYTFDVGAGGIFRTKGGDTEAFGWDLDGGGSGGNGGTDQGNGIGVGGDGGSGGGGGSWFGSQPGGSSTATAPGLGEDGGGGFQGSSGTTSSGGGGGGATGAGGNAASNQGGDGGAGFVSSITGVAVAYGAGGGGSAQTGTPGTGGSSSAGGDGGNRTTPAGDGSTPGSGGGGRTTVGGGDCLGADGIIHIRFPKTITLTDGDA